MVVERYSPTCTLTKQHFQFLVSHSKLSLPLLSLSSVLVSSHPLPFQVFVLHLCFSPLLPLQTPWLCSHCSVHGLAGPEHVFESEERAPVTSASSHLILTQPPLHLCIRMWKSTFCTEYCRYRSVYNKVSCGIRRRFLNTHCICTP